MSRLATLVVAAGLLAGSSSAEAARKPATHTITIDAARFTPADLAVRIGDTVVWINRDILAHTATAKDGGFDSKVIEPGKSWKFVARKSGEFAYTCSFHPMNGTLKVR